MTLALILATLDQLPEPEESILSEQCVLTPVSVRSFPRPEDAQARQLSKHCSNPTSRIPSLREYLVHYIRLHPDTVNHRQCQDDLLNDNLKEAIELNVPFYLRYNGDFVIHPLGRPQRLRPADRPHAMFLTSATLIVVPASLLLQWTAEINKHCDETLRVLVLWKDTNLPSAMELATEYDVCIMIFFFHS